VVLSGTIDPNTSDTKYLEYGKQFTNTVKLNCFDGKGMSSGSAVVIDPYWIITAAHVVEDCHSWTVLVGDEKYHIKNMISHENYKSNVFGFADVALGNLEKPIFLDFYPEIYDNDDEVGQLCSIAGWGLTGNFNSGTKNNDGKIRAGSNLIDKTERHVLICSPSRQNEKITQLEFLICSGDSGGGLFIGNKLAGINSSVIGYDGKSDSTYGDESCHTRVSLFHDWIKETISK
jgi:V8-like Glu-specific endopeptidase